MDGGHALLGVAALAVSCGIAHAAGKGDRGAWAWGVLGPIGWLVAAIHSVRPPEPPNPQTVIACDECLQPSEAHRVARGNTAWCAACGRKTWRVVMERGRAQAAAPSPQVQLATCRLCQRFTTTATGTCQHCDARLSLREA